jgi:hypothetical protein
MKIILSRKGFDSQYGKAFSPILPDGTLLSLPIPQDNDVLNFKHLFYQDKSYLNIIKELKPSWSNHYNDNQTAHLDPDLRKDVLKSRPKGWKAIFGQSAAAQGHLAKQKVAVGDIFLFFGSFAQTEKNDEGILAYQNDKNYPTGAHLVFGYLQIGEIYHANEDKEYANLPEYVKNHSHANKKYRDQKGKKRVKNCMYVASNKLSINPDLPGSGILNFSKSRVLTKKGMSKSMWDLPAFFNYIKMSYHSKKSFQPGYFQSAAKGQEFVIDSNGDKALQKKLEKWVTNIIINN